MMRGTPQTFSAGATQGNQTNWSEKEKPQSPRFPYVFLFVPVCDAEQMPLDIIQEYNRIHAIMSATGVRHLSTSLSPTWVNVVKEVCSRHPLVLHFACRSNDSAIKIFRRAVVPEVILGTLQSHNEEARRLGKARVQLVVFNTCSSHGHAEKLKQVVDFAIGHRGEVDDEDAVEFTHVFYDCLFKGESLWNSMQQARGCCRFDGYELYTDLDATAFRLELPGEQAKETMGGERETTIVNFLKEVGIMRQDQSACKELGGEGWSLEDLIHLEDHALDVLTETKLYPDEKRAFWAAVSRKLRELSVGTAHLCSLSGHEADQSGFDASSESEADDTPCSEDEFGRREVVVATNRGDKSEFQKHLTRFLEDFGSFSGNHQVWTDDKRKVKQTECGEEEPREWTMCMLVWLRLSKDARMHEDSREKWQKTLSSPSEDSMLRTLDEILSRNDVNYKYWDATKFDDWGCEKRYGAVIFVTHELVRACLASEDSCEQWDKRVMRGWNASDEDASLILKRMNKFLWSQVEAIEIETEVVEAASYVCYLRMQKVTCLILFEYLETYKKQIMAGMEKEGQADSSLSSLYQGFCLFASSSNEAFSLEKTSLRYLRAIRKNLRLLACLPDRLLLLLGPVRRAEGLLGEEGRSMLRAHQQAKVVEWEEAMASGQGVHLRGPAGTGKTFMALRMMLRELEKDRSCSVLFLLQSEGFVYSIAQWMWSMARWKLVDGGLFDRVFFCYRGERGWDGPFWKKESEGDLRRRETKVELLLDDAPEYKYVVIDKAHHVFSDQEATDYIKRKSYDRATMVLMSDSSQADVTDISYPEGLLDVYLTEVVRNSQRTTTASLLSYAGVSKAKEFTRNALRGTSQQQVSLASMESTCPAMENKSTAPTGNIPARFPKCHHAQTSPTNIATNDSRMIYSAERKSGTKKQKYEITREEVNKHFSMRRCEYCKQDLLLCRTCPPTKHDSSNDVRGWVNPIKVS
eukprot:764800-Hanusia_phi.AAC.1